LSTVASAAHAGGNAANPIAASAALCSSSFFKAHSPVNVIPRVFSREAAEG